MEFQRIVIAGTNSGCGKTTVTMGILSALVKRGLKTQPFKVGPDYIDPMFHTFITGVDSRNLDSWMLEEETVSRLFVKSACKADISVIEGVMGLYDGYGGNTVTGSTAHVAKILKAPVVLVVNGEGISLSIEALVRGFRDYDRDVNIRGIIINNIKSEGHFRLLKEIIEENTDLAVVGYLPRLQEISLPSRHLGLIPGGEIDDLREKINLLTAQVEKTIDLDLLIKLSGEGEKPECRELEFSDVTSGISPVIAVAKDKAFNFYYKDNLDLLEMMGARLVFFSPMEDKQLPDGIDGLYIGGGYPEIFAQQLQENRAMREDIKRVIETGMPAYAECGGLMYMSESIRTREGQVYEMVGVVPGRSEMTGSLKRFGYVEVEMLADNILSKQGGEIKAHEFHYSVTHCNEGISHCYRVSKKRKDKETASWNCGFKVNNLLAAYPHVHFWSSPAFAEGFIRSCIRYKTDNR